MDERSNVIITEVNGIHVYLTFTPFPNNDVCNNVRAILKNSYVRTLDV